jgi:hypothetical protein
MHLVQLLLPLYTNAGDPIGEEAFSTVRRELTERFGGVTAYARAPASGLWKTGDGRVHRDDMMMVEVVVEHLDPAWWGVYRTGLERRFEQDSLFVRAIPIERL